MGKFAIECQKCGSINTASTGIFARKKFPCGTCGSEINVKTGRIISKICPNCENVFVFDQAKAKDRRCPVCNEPIEASRFAASTYRYTTINCPQCSCDVDVDKNSEIYECPLCGMNINVQAELARNDQTKGNKLSIIQCELDNKTLVWKHPIEDFNYGSLLKVHESQEAIFFLDGQALDLFGPGSHELKTGNIPGIEKQYGGITAQKPFHAEVYFINQTVQMGFKWGTGQRVKYIDPKTGLDFSIGASGEFKIQVSDSRKLLVKLVGTATGLKHEDWEDESDNAGSARYEYLLDLFGADIQSCVKRYLAETIIKKDIFLPNVDMYRDDIASAIREHLSAVFEEYGLRIPAFTIASISLPENEPSYKAWIEKNRNISLGKAFIDDEIILAEKEARKASAEQRESLAVKKQEIDTEAYEMRVKGFNQQDLINKDIQIAYADALGQMGSNGGGGGGGIASDMVNMMMGAKMANTVMDKYENSPVGKTTDNSDAEGTWTCSCGKSGNTGKFCSECGSPKPETWDCACGKKGNTGKFCSECGSPKPVAWDCSCGKKGNTGKFCSECGTPKPETWDCSCGAKNNTGKCCPGCGARKPE